MRQHLLLQLLPNKYQEFNLHWSRRRRKRQADARTIADWHVLLEQLSDWLSFVATGYPPGVIAPGLPSDRLRVEKSRNKLRRYGLCM